MKNIVLIFCTAFMFFGSTANAQVQYKIELLADNETYLVSMVPQESWAAPFNKTSTAQVTIKVPTDAFQPIDVVNLQNGVMWEANSRYNAPEEAPAFDYITFGLVSLGTSGLSFSEEVEIPLFEFRNAEGCTGAVSLVNNETDAFLPPNYRKANIGQEMTVLGARGDAFTSLVEGGEEVNCMLTGVNEPDNIQQLEAKLFPNPVVGEFAVEWQWAEAAGEATLLLRNTNGQMMLLQQVELSNGKNKFLLNAEGLPSAVYQLELIKNNIQYSMGSLIKVEQ